MIRLQLPVRLCRFDNGGLLIGAADQNLTLLLEIVMNRSNRLGSRDRTPRDVYVDLHEEHGCFLRQSIGRFIIFLGHSIKLSCLKKSPLGKHPSHPCELANLFLPTMGIQLTIVGVISMA
jgi:hypothetical protein